MHAKKCIRPCQLPQGTTPRPLAHVWLIVHGNLCSILLSLSLFLSLFLPFHSFRRSLSMGQHRGWISKRTETESSLLSWAHNHQMMPLHNSQRFFFSLSLLCYCFGHINKSSKVENVVNVDRVCSNLCMHFMRTKTTTTSWVIPLRTIGKRAMPQVDKEPSLE